MTCQNGHKAYLRQIMAMIKALGRPLSDRRWKMKMEDERNVGAHIPAGLVVGCKKVREFVPNVRLARFQRESLPSRLGFSVAEGVVEVDADASLDGEA